MFRRSFNGEPLIGDTFEMARGVFRIRSITHDPIPGSNDPEMLIGAERISDGKHWPYEG